MTKATEYFNWQAAGTADPHYNKSAAPALVSLKTGLMARYGGQDLGCFGVRDVRGGGAISTHAFGAAWDWRYMNADGTGLLGRAATVNTVLPLLINNSTELGIQLIVDYIGCRSWNANRSADKFGGWKPGKPDPYGMGKGWAGWLHIEVNPHAWSDGRSMADKLGVQTAPGAPTLPPVDFKHLVFGLTPLVPYAKRGVLAIGSSGFWVQFVQAACTKAGFGCVVDGGFGGQTRTAVQHFQTSRHLKADGIVGVATWTALNAVAVS
jgi:peptidoglycan hydrolase-like protein with peptidoglycan-binding domain